MGNDIRLVLRVLAVVVGPIALVLLFFFLLWLQGDTRTGYEPSPTLLNEVGIWRERLYLVGLGMLAALLVRQSWRGRRGSKP